MSELSPLDSTDARKSDGLLNVFHLQTKLVVLASVSDGCVK